LHNDNSHSLNPLETWGDTICWSHSSLLCCMSASSIVSDILVGKGSTHHAVVHYLLLPYSNRYALNWICHRHIRSGQRQYIIDAWDLLSGIIATRYESCEWEVYVTACQCRVGQKNLHGRRGNIHKRREQSHPLWHTTLFPICQILWSVVNLLTVSWISTLIGVKRQCMWNQQSYRI